MREATPSRATSASVASRQVVPAGGGAVGVAGTAGVDGVTGATTTGAVGAVGVVGVVGGVSGAGPMGCAVGCAGGVCCAMMLAAFAQSRPDAIGYFP